MKTLLICGRTEMPRAAREIVEKGSTALEERPAPELTAAAGLDADRVVFWATRDDTVAREVAAKLVAAEARERREVIVFVTPDDNPDIPGLAANEVFVWPRDQERLEMAFMTGA